MAKHSAGILLYRIKNGSPEVLLVHPGGPFWVKKDRAAWSIPKGEFSGEEDPLDAAIREFYEETGITPEGPFESLGEIKQSGGKIVHAWIARGECDPSGITSNTFEMEFPPKSGKIKSFPEVDKAAWFTPEIAKEKIHRGQVPFIDRLLQKINI